MEDRLRESAWKQLNSELYPGPWWTVGESANYKAFFMHGWDAATRAPDPLLEKMAGALEELVAKVSHGMGEYDTRIKMVLKAKRILQKYRERTK